MTNAEKFKDVFGFELNTKTDHYCPFNSTRCTNLPCDDCVNEFWSSEYKHKGVYECFNCGADSVVWDSDFDFEDFGYEGEGIVHVCHCSNCGAEIEYRIPIEDKESGE